MNVQAPPRTLGPRHTTLVGMLAVALLLLFIPRAAADTAEVTASQEGWFARSKPRSPAVEIPCPPPPIPPPATGCGEVTGGEIPAPQGPDTGGYVVSSAGGDAGASDAAGDTGWAAFEWDMLSYLGVSVDRFVVTLTQAPDNRGDTPGPYAIQACNIVAPWGASPGSNPWQDRPTTDCASAVVPTVAGDTFTFDLTAFARTWVEGKGYGVAIRPGTPEQQSGLTPFQLTFAGYETTAANADAVRPKVQFAFTPAAGFDSGFDDGAGFDDTTLDGGFDGGTDFAADPGIDLFPGDVGSETLEEFPVSEPAEPASPATAAPATQPISRSPGFPFAGWLLVPLGAIALWATGFSLGPAGDPVPTREGGVTRALAARRYAGEPHEPSTDTPQGGPSR